MKLQKIKVYQLDHINQFVVYAGGLVAFISYQSLICELNGNDLILNSDMWDYSNTTRKHFKKFINEYTRFEYVDRMQWIKEIRRLLNNGIYYDKEDQ